MVRVSGDLRVQNNSAFICYILSLIRYFEIKYDLNKERIIGYLIINIFKLIIFIDYLILFMFRLNKLIKSFGSI